MAFFASPQRELYEHRLKRSSSTTSIRTRPCRPFGSQAFPSRSRINSSDLLPSASIPDTPSAQYNPSRTPVPPPVPPSSTPSPSSMTALHTLEQTSRLSSESSLQASVPSRTAQLGDSASHLQSDMLHPNSGVQGLHPSTPPPSVSSSRSRPNFDTGSVSDSGVFSRAPLAYRYSNVSSAHEGTLNVQLPSPSSPNLSIPGYISDGCNPECSPSPLQPSRLDVKRLLSKPAAPSLVSDLSIASDPESHTHLRSPLNSSKAWPSKAGVSSHPKLIVDPPTMTRSESPSAPQPEQTRASPTQQRPRKLLRKKSASGQNRAPSSAPLPSDTSLSPPLQIASTTQRPAAAPPRPRSQRSPRVQGLIGGRAAVSAHAPSSGSGRLTPAGAIAQAYKEQDMRREALAAAVHTDKNPLPIIPVGTPLSRAFGLPTSEQNVIQTAERASHDTELAGSPESYVMVGSAQEEFSHTYNHGQSITGPATHFASTGANLPVKSLTRKVSTHLRRGLAAVSGAHLGRGSGDGEDEQADRLRDKTNRVHRRERQQSFSLHKAKRKPESLRVSTDIRPGSGSEDYMIERSCHSAQGKSTLDSPNAVAKGKGKEKAQEKDETSTGAKLWRLVKRISAGGLRERFQTPSAPPPVPSIPKELPPLPPHTAFEVQVPSESTNGDGGVDANHSGDKGKSSMGHSIDTNVSANGVSPHSDGHLSTVASMPSGTNGFSQGHSVGSHPRRPSISSSPQSSEPSSTHFFRSHSSHSSFSSIMGNSSPPPVPVPTRALARSPSPRARSRLKNGPSSARGTSRDEPVSHARLRKRSSPDIPTFSVSDVVNNFILRRPSLASRQRHHAPAQSLSRIVTAPAGEISATPPLRRAGSEVRPGTRQRGRGHGRGPHGDPVFEPDGSGQNRDSHGSDRTVIVRPHSASTATLSAGTSAGGGSVGRLTFREMGGTRREAWTSQEKEDKWADLLNRSARAGGTLHLGAGGAQLASDNIRFSSSTLESEMTTPMV